MRFYILSILLHLLLVIPAFLVSTSRPEAKVEVELAQSENDGSDSGYEKVVIKELTENGEGEAPVNFYWGLGITSIDYFEPKIGQYVHEVSYIAYGYNADKYGLQIGDLIYLINDMPITSDNDVRGDGPKTMKLTILRKNVIINITVERGKVYY